MSDWQRLENVIKWSGLSANAFSLVIGLKRAENIYQIKKGNHGISKELADRITTKYCNINAGWLLTGEGQMLLPEDGGNALSNDNSSDKRIKYFPDIDASATPTEMFDPENKNTHRYIIVPGFDDCEYALNVWGDSMFPILNSGEIILTKEWKESFVEFGLIYLIITKMNHRMIKYLQPGASDETLSCVSANKFYKPIEVKKADIIKLYLIKGHISRNTI